MPTKKITGKLEIKSRGKKKASKKERKKRRRRKSKTVSPMKKSTGDKNSWFKVEFGIAIETSILGSGALPTVPYLGTYPTVYEYVLQVAAPSCNLQYCSFPFQGGPRV